MGSAEGTEEGVEDLERAGNTVLELTDDIGAVDAQDAEKLRGWKLPNFCSRSQSLIYLRAKIIIIILRGKTV